MEIVSVKLVMFKQKPYTRRGEYCGYCPALGAFHVMTSFEKLLAYMQDRLERDLAGRIHYRNLKNRGWEVSENSAKPPTFADEELVKRTEESFEVKIKRTHYRRIICRTHTTKRPIPPLVSTRE